MPTACYISESAARAAEDARLKKRTLTNLYNQRPTWLAESPQAISR